VAVDVVEVGPASAVTVRDRVALEKNPRRGRHSGQGFAGEGLGGEKQRGEGALHFFFALGFFLPWLASATGS
jgi:hypothetical protein